jgi:hypothetical protein
MTYLSGCIGSKTLSSEKMSCSGETTSQLVIHRTKAPLLSMKFRWGFSPSGENFKKKKITAWQ